MLILRLFSRIAALVLIAGCATSSYVPQNAPASVSPPQVKVGDYWEYAVRDGYTGIPRGLYRYEVDRADPDRIVVNVTHDGYRLDTLVYAAGWNGRELPLTNLQRFRYDPPFPTYMYPLQPGKSWNVVVSSTDPVNGRRYQTHVQGKVVGWERIKVPAGEFDALKVQRYVFAGNMGGQLTQEEISETDWYVPSVHRAVRTHALSQHYDMSRGGGDGGGEYPLRVRGDWLVADLVSYGTR